MDRSPSASVWEGPGLWTVIGICILCGAFSLAVSEMVINGPPKSLFGKGNKFPVKGRTVLITGGSQGMGRGVANLLSHKGANVILVARDTSKLKDAVEYISKAAPEPEKQRFHYISADVTKSEENVRIIKEATEWNNGQPPDIVWANAGSASPGLFLDTPASTLQSQMELNYLAAAYLAQSTLKSWFSSPDRKSTTEGYSKLPSRHFIMTSTVATFVGIAGYAPYAPPKSALRSLHDTLRCELQLYNGYLSHPDNKTIPKVKIHTVFPGTILSPGFEEENKLKHPVTKVLEDGDPKQTEHEVAVAAVRGLEKGKSIVATQTLGKLIRAGGLMGSARDSWLKDTVLGWIMSVAWLFVVPDLEGKVSKWGKENGMPLHGDDE